MIRGRSPRAGSAGARFAGACLGWLALSAASAVHGAPVVAEMPAAAPVAAPTEVHHAQAPGRPVAANVRLMYYASSASVRGVRSQLVWREDCDPAVEQCWEDADGNIVGATVDVPTPAGAGYTQVDVLYVDDAVCVGRVGNHLMDVTTGVLRSLGSSAFVSTDGCSDYWRPVPRLLVLASPGVPGLRVRQGPYTLAGKTVDAISVTNTGPAGVTHTAYDARSGLLLVESTRTQGAAVATVGPGGQVQPGAGGSLLTYSQLLGVKTVPGPPQQPLPDAVARVSGFTYACSVTTSMAGAQPLQVPCRQDAEVVQRAPGWLLLRVVRQQASMMGLPPEVTESAEVITAGGVGGPYASPAWLQGLARGAILDDDAITGIRVQVGAVDGASVVVTASSPAQRATYVYDRGSGWLRTIVVEQDMGMSVTTVRLDLQEVR